MSPVRSCLNEPRDAEAGEALVAKKAARAESECGSDTDSASTIVQAEQAIFTSLRGPMGEGYRLVAMSPGITAEERTEITRRSPSHDSICDSDAAAHALASYDLATCRHCVAWSRYGGKEHTARGGNRVHTHLVVLENDAWRRFACNPFCVQSALAEVIGPTPNVKPGLCLPLLDLQVNVAGTADAGEVPHDLLGRACQLAYAIMGDAAGESTMIVTMADPPLHVLRWALGVLPLTYRQKLDCSGNLHFATCRGLRLTCLNTLTVDTQRSIQGRDVLVLNLPTESTAAVSPVAGWFDFVLGRCRQRRLDEVCLLADQLDGDVDAACLDRLMTIVHDADLIEQADQAQLEQLANRYGNLRSLHPAERRLVRQLLSAAVRRSANLSHVPA